MYGLSPHEREHAINSINRKINYLLDTIVLIEDHPVQLFSIYSDALINPTKYVSEIQNRAWSLYNYAKERNLECLFITLTLPSEYHPYRTLSSGQKIKNKSYRGFSPDQGSKKLSRMLKTIFDDRAYKNIPKDDRCYFRVVEPHKSGVPHLHISLFVPAADKAYLVDAIAHKFPAPRSKVEISLNSPVAYLMKYIFKTLDDTRNGGKLTDLTLWYKIHKIRRFQLSYTLVNIDYYRRLKGSYSLLDMTKYQRNGAFKFLKDAHGRLDCILDYSNEPLYTRDKRERLKYRLYLDSSINPLHKRVTVSGGHYSDIQHYVLDANGMHKVPSSKIDLTFKEEFPNRVVPLSSPSALLLDEYNSFNHVTGDSNRFNALHRELQDRNLLDGQRPSYTPSYCELVARGQEPVFAPACNVDFIDSDFEPIQASFNL